MDREKEIQTNLDRANAAVRKTKQSVNRMIDQCNLEAARLKRLQVADINRRSKHIEDLRRIRLKIDRIRLERSFNL